MSELNNTFKKLNSVMKPMNLSFWKDLQEECGGAMAAATAVSGGALGATPCPALGQISGGNISGCMVNGVPVQGKSVKKKKKKPKKNESFINFTSEESISSDSLTLRESINQVIKDLLDEDFNEDYEAITEQIAKYLDRLNFKFANTEDIVYKKEGEYKYLFKFDNEIGTIKIKVLKGDDVLIEKEYEIDETQDIQPIFDEIENIYRRYGL